jgi:hypothetical protein
MTDPNENFDTPEALREVDDRLQRFWRRLRPEPARSPRHLDMDQNTEHAHSPSGLRLSAHRHPFRMAEYVRVVDANAPTRIVAHVYLLHWDRPGPQGHAVTVIVRTPDEDAPSIYRADYGPFQPTPPDLALRLVARHTRTAMRIPVVQDVELGEALPASLRRALALQGDVQDEHNYDEEDWYERLFPPLFDEFEGTRFPKLFEPTENGPYFEADLEEEEEAIP